MSTVLQFPGATPLSAVVAEEIRALMGRRMVTQKQLADVLHVSQSQISKRLKGQIPFDIIEIERLAEFFGVHPTQLLGGAQSKRDGGGSPTPWYPLHPVTNSEPVAISMLPLAIPSAAAA